MFAMRERAFEMVALALVLVLSLQVALGQPNAADMIDLAGDGSPEQYAADSSNDGGYDHEVKRYVIADVDVYGNAMDPMDRLRWFQMNDLLEELSTTIPTPLALQRSSRIPQPGNPSASAGVPFVGRLVPSDKKPQKVIIEWNGSKPNSAITVHQSVGGHDNGKARSGAAASQPGDYEDLKRMENLNKWNNLRGMWGKRSDPTSGGRWGTLLAANRIQAGNQLRRNQQVM